MLAILKNDTSFTGFTLPPCSTNPTNQEEAEARASLLNKQEATAGRSMLEWPDFSLAGNKLELLDHELWLLLDMLPKAIHQQKQCHSCSQLYTILVPWHNCSHQVLATLNCMVIRMACS